MCGLGIAFVSQELRWLIENRLGGTIETIEGASKTPDWLMIWVVWVKPLWKLHVDWFVRVDVRGDESVWDSCVSCEYTRGPLQVTRFDRTALRPHYGGLHEGLY